jgi:hypothetical protein
MTECFLIQRRRAGRTLGVVVLLAQIFSGGNIVRGEDTPKAAPTDLVPLKLKLPAPVFAGTPKDPPRGLDVEPTPEKPPPPMMIPADVHNVAPGKKIICSDKGASAADLAKIADGNKEAVEDSAAILKKGLQWVQFDLGTPQEIFAIVVWHAHDTAKVYNSVIVQVADDPDFGESARTVFNNDRDNSSGLGVGKDRQYFESYQGKLIDAKGARARYVRLYSHGSTESALNEYTEVEIYARPAK